MTERHGDDPREFDITQFFNALLKTRNVAIVAAILSSLLFLVFIAITGLTIPKKTTYLAN